MKGICFAKFFFGKQGKRKNNDAYMREKKGMVML